MKKLLEKVLPLGKFWTDAWSIVEGCSPVSPGCANCWLSALEGRVGARTVEGAASIPSPLAPGGVFNGVIRCREDRLDLPLRKKQPRVFAIWSDLFHESVPSAFIVQALATITRAKDHHFIIITKRAERADKELRSFNGVFFPNVTILVSMEDQARASERIPHAARLARYRWRVGVLCEPLLGPVNLCLDSWPTLPIWILAGGESGPKARLAHPGWFRSLRDQAQAKSIPYLFKGYLLDKKSKSMYLDGELYMEVPVEKRGAGF